MLRLMDVPLCSHLTPRFETVQATVSVELGNAVALSRARRTTARIHAREMGVAMPPKACSMLGISRTLAITIV